MKVRCKLLFRLTLFCCLLLYGNAAAQESQSSWNYAAAIDTAGNNKYKACFLTGDVYAGALPDLGDLRVVDREGQFVPYYIQRGYAVERQQRVTYQTKLVSQFREESDSVTDIKIVAQQEAKDIVGNKLLFELPAERNFLKHIEVSGSFDGQHWDYIKRDHLYKTETLAKNETDLGDVKKYKYYRIRILDNIEGIAFPQIQLVFHAAEQQWQDYQRNTQMSYDIKNEGKFTMITLHNSQRLKLKKISLDMDGNFQRTYEILIDGKPVALANRQELYNLVFEKMDISHKTIDFAQQPVADPSPVIRIHNRDDRPLAIKNIQADYYVDKIVFADDGNGPYQLLWGNHQVRKPGYEIELHSKYIESERQDSAEMGPVTIRTSPEVPKQRSIPWHQMFNITIAVVAIILMYIIMRRMSEKQ